VISLEELYRVVPSLAPRPCVYIEPMSVTWTKHLFPPKQRKIPPLPRVPGKRQLGGTCLLMVRANRITFQGATIFRVTELDPGKCASFRGQWLMANDTFDAFWVEFGPKGATFS
jgi:hypothetical protein